jgi:hypothetical protein
MAPFQPFSNCETVGAWRETSRTRPSTTTMGVGPSRVRSRPTSTACRQSDGRCSIIFFQQTNRGPKRRTAIRIQHQAATGSFVFHSFCMASSVTPLLSGTNFQTKIAASTLKPPYSQYAKP